MIMRWQANYYLRQLYLFVRRFNKTNILIGSASLIIFGLFVKDIYWYRCDRAIPILYMEKTLNESIIFDKGTGCNMPNIDPFSDAIMSLNTENWYVDNLVCYGTDWVQCDDNQCYVIEDILNKYKDVTCTYKDIIYVSDESYYFSDPVTKISKEKYILEKSDFVKVSCKAYGHFSLFPPRWSGSKAGIRKLPENTNFVYAAPTQFVPNIMILGFDSISKNSFIRSMPRSYKFLTEIMEAVVLNGYNVVGDGTSANLFALLTGKSELELPDWRKGLSQKKVDHTKFLFSLLRDYGYRTAYLEDRSGIGTFQYRHNGFDEMPADHYMYHFFQEITDPIDLLPNYKKMYFCAGDIPVHGLMLNLTKSFLKLGGNYFGFTFLVDISHDFNKMSIADDDFVSFLQDFKKKYLHNTMLIVMGDHGSRYNVIRNTYQGLLEERLPLMAISLPLLLKKPRSFVQQALLFNKDVLTTPFDIHTTILHVLKIPAFVNSYKVPGADMPRGLSLLQPIPKTRSCSEAGILPHWCACTKWVDVSINDRNYQRAADELVQFINNITKEARQICAERMLYKIEWIMRQSVNNMLMRFSGSVDGDGYLSRFKSKGFTPDNEYYMIRIILNPGKSNFEGTLKYNSKKDIFSLSEKDISRTNAYGTEPKCISNIHPHLNKYCYCQNVKMP